MLLFLQHRVVGSLGTQPRQQHCVGPDVSGVTECRWKIVAHLIAHGEQQPSGRLGQICGQFGVGQTHLSSIPEPCAPMIRALPRLNRPLR